MAITFRHDAAAIVPPSNQSTRKYGQSLVLQQQQQKYAAQQAGYDRMFQLGRDQQQASRQAVMQGQQNAVNAIRDANQFANAETLQESQRKFQADQQQAELAAKFMEEARKQSSGIIMEDIKGGSYDPATSRKLQQNLVAESEALGNPQLDATQRAEALQKIRAERALLTANRMEKPPEPTPQERFDQSIVTGQDGTQYLPNAKGGYDPLKQQEQQPQRPTSADEAFRADPKTRDKYMEDAKTIVTKGGEEPLTEESRQKAAELAKKLYHSDNGLGDPNAAPALSGQTQSSQGAEKSILEQPGPTSAPPVPGSRSAIQGAERSVLEPSTEEQQGLSAAYHADMTGKGYRLVTPSDGSRPYYSSEAVQPAAPVQAAPEPSQAPTTPTQAPAQNPWSEVATGGTDPAQQRAPMPLTSNASSANPAQETPMNQTSQSASTPKVPNFTSMIEGTKDPESRRVFSALQGIYQKSTPEIQSAIGVVTGSTESSDDEFIAARDYLKSNGIDIKELAKYKHSGGSRKGRNK